MSRKFTQHEEDSFRLPEGFKRIAYDADTRRYTFRDANSTLYQGEPGLEYGVLTPVPPSHSSMEHARPSAFASDRGPDRRLSLQANSETSPPPPKTFYDILPPELITSSSITTPLSDSTSSSTIRAGSRVAKAVRKSTLPKMQGVVHSLRRSMTSIKKPRSPSFSEYKELHEDDTIGLISNTSASSLTSTNSNRPPFPNGPRSAPPRRSTLGVNFTSSS
ncbi:hypothetical protein CPB84DRAFT_1765075 [Gymnopilus junonius]|uniref:Uncharacterized protein n=1 Tax=Gymnopilus junonius TaxID=109634 RepID=A0A9P5NZ95_GYMJU|nr:hypothetical protein CPB84DRAFT_1765075 [Gymnopilus junonius]